MISRWFGVLGLGLILAWPVLGSEAPDQSMYPVMRPGPTQNKRPQFALFIKDMPGVQTSLRPTGRPEGLHPGRSTVRAQPVPAANPVTVSGKGAVCGVPSILGERLKSFRGKLQGCGIEDPVRVFAIDGVALSHGAIMDCTTAKALNSWVANGVRPTIGRLGGGVTSLWVIGDYSCRTRNSKPGAKLSEHGKGHAVDIAGFTLKNGSRITVKSGWRDGVQGKLLQRMHRAACGTFGTVLGPNSDRYHHDHFHLDTARYRSGSYCR